MSRHGQKASYLCAPLINRCQVGNMQSVCNVLSEVSITRRMGISPIASLTCLPDRAKQRTCVKFFV